MRVASDLYGDKIFFSADIETDGPGVLNHSMIALGVCIVGRPAINYYVEIKPIHPWDDANFTNPNAMCVACKQLNCLADLYQYPEYDPEHPDFDQRKVLEVLREEGKEPGEAMEGLAEFVYANSGKRGLMIAMPASFEAEFIAPYCHKFISDEFQQRMMETYGVSSYKNPFGHSAWDLNSLLSGRTGDLYDHIKKHIEIDLPHNALQDAIVQARGAEYVFELMRKFSGSR